MIQKISEKRRPHYELSLFKELFSNAKTRQITQIAHKGAASEGYMTVEEIKNVIERLSSKHFYKSMTTYHSHEIWQDVYHFQDGDKKLYIKIQLSVDRDKSVLIQMKRDEGSDE
jgi:hypothetical protein